METKNTKYSHNILSIGLVLLVVFIIAILLTGFTINRIAERLNNMAINELCESHRRSLYIELNKTNNISTLAHQFIDTGNQSVLKQMHHDLTLEPLSGKTYAIIIDSCSRIIFHPAISFIGQILPSPEQREIVKEVAATNVNRHITTKSEYLGIDVERIFYQLQVGNRLWVVAISSPRLDTDNYMGEFHRYTIIIGLLAVVLFSALLFFSQARWRQEYELRRKAQHESQKLQLQQIIEQVNPHFLFNSLNSLYSLINSNTAIAREFVLKLSSVYRYVLERGRDTLSPLDGEIEFTMKYYFLQKIRFERQIELSIEIDPTLKSYKIPSMGLQTVVENAIKHNKITPQNPLYIKIYSREHSLIIENNYTSSQDHDTNSIGVGLERIRSIYNYYGQQNIEVTHTADTFRCVMPLLKADLR